jgi:hypothetical protein
VKHLCLIPACLTLLVAAAYAEQTPVDFKALQAALPDEVISIKRSEMTGDHITADATSFSVAEGTYDVDDASRGVTIAVSDFIAMPEALQGIAAMLEMTLKIETSELVHESCTLAKHKAMLVYEPEDESGQITVVIANRFLVQIEAHGIDMPTLKTIAEGVKYDTLVKLAE